MACKQPSPAIISCKPPALGGHVGARSLAAAVTFGAGVALSTVTAPVSSATAQELERATSAGGASSDAGLAVATDPRGNSYVTGAFSGTATFGEGENNETTLESATAADAGTDVFVAKYDRNGRLLWAKRAGSGGPNERGLGIATDSSGNSYVTGIFEGTATFGEGEDNETVLNAAGIIFFIDIFVAKYDRSGRLLWAKRAGSTDIDDSGGIATNPRGNSYVIGNFRGTATFGEGEDEIELSGGGIFIANYNRNGRLLWAKRAGAQQGLGIATDSSGNSYVTGAFFGRATFGEGEDNETVLSTAGSPSDIFVAKYDRNGRLLWAKRAGGASFDAGLAVATDPRGNSYVTGGFRVTATFGEGEANETVFEGDGVGLFVAKFAPDGTLLWGTSFARGPAGRSFGVAVDASGNSYVTGDFFRMATFGEGEDNETVLSAAGVLDIFVTKYDRDGRLLWAERAGGRGVDSGFGIATDPRGNSYVTGNFRGTATFGEGEDNETVLEAMAPIAGLVAAPDVFVAKYGGASDQDQCADPDRSATVVIDGNDTGVSNVLTDTGCTILDLILQALRDAVDRDDFIRSVALLTRTLLRDRLITAEEAGIKRTAAAQATFPFSGGTAR